MAPADAAHHHRLAPRRGGHVRRAWPVRGGRGRPSQPLARWLARQVGPTKVHPKHRRQRRLKPAGGVRSAGATQGSSAPALTFQTTGASESLQLVRSYQIPADDPAAARLANLSWTYDSALSATAFSELGDQPEAQQLLDQLAALQRSDGSIDFAFNTQNAQSIPLFRSGTVAWLGLAAARFRSDFCSSRYDSVTLAAARWLLARQITSPSDPAYGLLTGGPDVTWTSTQHNLVARAFFEQLANLIDGTSPEHGHKACPAGLGGLSAQAASTFSASLRQAVSLIDAAVSRDLFVRSSSSSAYFREGAGDDIRPLDSQALGILWLVGQNRTADANAVESYANSTMLLTGRTLALSSDPATYNETYHSPGPFTGYRPYADTGSPDVLWMEGTLEMRLALGALHADTSSLDQSVLSWLGVTGAAGPLQADRAVTTSAFNEYHVWPASAAASWALLDVTGFDSALE